MLIVFRADASFEIGSGHIMRCLTLAADLTEKGHQCHFICRDHVGNLINDIRKKGFTTHVLTNPISTSTSPPIGEPYSSWLNVTQEKDAIESSVAINEFDIDWLIVDHYALDIDWESKLKEKCTNLMVIDDLANRSHSCNLLLDQTYGRVTQDYQDLVPDGCCILSGSKYAILRPEFHESRSFSLSRRVNPHFKRLLITMGGVDKDNSTSKILRSINEISFPNDFEITVIMGEQSRCLSEVNFQAGVMRHKTTVLVGVNNMAKVMSCSDLVIGAAGTTSWERCCLGLPSIVVVLADNQKTVARNLAEAGAAYLIADLGALETTLPILINRVKSAPKLLFDMSVSCSKISDGLGATKVVRMLEV